MKIAYVHVLPLEYYPPAINTLSLLSREPGFEVRAWSSGNMRGLPEWKSAAVAVWRHWYPRADSHMAVRLAGYPAWHLRTAAGLAAWSPDAVISIEPHSALATWLYYRLFAGRAALFIHHHEYYAPEDFQRSGMRLLQRTLLLQRNYLFPRAAWVSQTNGERLRLLREWNPGIRDEAARVLPNHPMERWVQRASAIPRNTDPGKLRLVYVGSASFEDTFIREVAEWVAKRPDTTSLHVSGNNIQKDVWEWLASHPAANITADPCGYDYEALPELLRQFDVGLVLYKGNTANFVHNVPNKALEYLACGLHVWYPIQMKGMREFHRSFPAQPLTEIDFADLSDVLPRCSAPVPGEFPFTAESALARLISELKTAHARLGPR